MSQREPAVYNLEFTESDAPFWADAGSAARCTFLMPLPDPSGFVAFGVVGADSTVLFVARGRVREHLGAFIAAMEGGGARVELYTRVPLPWHLVKRYTSDEPYESQETEGPKIPPVQGLVGYGGGAEDGAAALQEGRTAALTSQSIAWPQELTPTRHVVVMPGSGEDDFLAFGVCEAPDRFVFVARGTVSAQLGGFLDRMKLDGATVSLCDWPEDAFLRGYLHEHYTELFGAGGSSLVALASMETLVSAQQAV